MYAGTTLTRYSGRILGTHQKIDKESRKNLDILIKGKRCFPMSSRILQFEGKNGPDGIKRKSPAQDEPAHYMSPFDDDDTKLVGMIKDHYDNLVKELKVKNDERSAFEAAWLAHAIVDGLTPAHHFPYEEKLTELLEGEGLERRNSVKNKMLMPGKNRRSKLSNNWKMWGPKGLFFTHGFFELGVAVLLAPMSFVNSLPDEYDLKQLKENGYIEMFRNTAREIAVLDIFELYYKRGWTPKLAKLIKKKLGPSIVKAVTITWYSALIDADLVKPIK